MRTAAIVGVHWGLVHLRGLREAGCEIVALAAADEARARDAARREGVPLGTSDVAALNDVDLVVVATPAATHGQVLRELPSPYLICEKPLIGVGAAPADLPDTAGRMFVNYAFSFLHTARTVARIVDGLGPPDRVGLDVGVGLPLSFTSTQWFLEAASHPLSWLLHLFGGPTALARQIRSDMVEVQLLAGRTPVAVGLRLGGSEGIFHHITFDWPHHQAAVRGRYVPGRTWQYDPVLLDAVAVNEGEWSASDCWIDANAASVAAMVRAFRGEHSWAEGIAGGLFDAERALWLERVLTDHVPPGAGHGR